MIRLLVVLLLGGIAGGALGDPIVTVSGGSVRGIDADGALSFKGIP
jgi:hypothetical protein